MLTLETTAQFRRDYKRVKKRGYKMALLEEVLDTLLAEEALLPRHRDHALTGQMKNYREGHRLPDWRGVSRLVRERLGLVAVQTGTHAVLFDE